jgi:hypothetical protein
MWFRMRMREPTSLGVPERCPVNSWLPERFGVVRDDALLCFLADQLIPRGWGRLILFTDQSVWRNAEDVPVAEYARDLRAGVSMGGGGVRWHTIVYPTDMRMVPDLARGLVESARALHQLQQLLGYPNTLSARALDNLAVLLHCGTEYFFLRCPADQPRAEDMVLAVSVDVNRPAFLIDLEQPVP